MPLYSLYMAWMRIKLRGENILIIVPLMPYKYLLYIDILAQYQSLLKENCVLPEHTSVILGNG